MSPDEILDRLITDHGTHGIAQMLAEVCRERGKIVEEPGMREFWEREADRFAAFSAPMPIRPAGIPVKVWSLHIRDRWGGDKTTIHGTRAAAIAALLEFDLPDDEDANHVRKLIEAGNYEKAEQSIGELWDSSGHEFNITEHGINVAEL